MRNAAIIFCKRDSFVDQSFYIRFLLINSFFSCLQNMIIWSHYGNQFAIWRCNQPTARFLQLAMIERSCRWLDQISIKSTKLFALWYALFVCYKLLRRFAKKKIFLRFTVNSHSLYIYIFSFLLNLNFIRFLITYFLYMHTLLGPTPKGYIYRDVFYIFYLKFPHWMHRSIWYIFF